MQNTSTIEENTLKTIKDLENALRQNNGTLIIKFSAEWCTPCKKLQPTINEFVNTLQMQNISNIRFIQIDVDECFELYAFLKTKKMMNGIPAIMRYEAGNLSYIPNNVIVGANVPEVSLFLTKCLQESSMFHV